ncbi:MAG TPA: hypothetical protein VHL59_13670 [Thermoanaerobaculia bacterium]|nr:hypothetical protein [Thermoanaerobaculia bacterium]
MPEHVRYEDDDLFNPETHHEHSDVPVRPLLVSLVIFIVFAAVTHVALWFMYKALVKGERARMEPPQTQVIRPADASVPQNQPLLQPFPRGNVPPQRNTPVTDLVDMRRTEETALNTYGWVDQQNGVARIPIEVAKDLFVRRAATLKPAVPAPPDGAPASPPGGGAQP